MLIEPISPSHLDLLSDESHISGQSDYVVFPESTNELKEIVKNAIMKKKTLVVQGSNTGLVGGSVPFNDVVLNMSKLKDIGEIKSHGDKNTIVVDAGVTLEEINKIANKKGLFFPVNPTESTATIGGVYSTNAKGPGCIKYGSISNYVESINVVFPSGDEYHIKKGQFPIENNVLKTPFDNNGLDLSSLDNNYPLPILDNSTDLIDFLCGKCGRFGIVTQLELKLIPKPEDFWGILFFFNDMNQTSQFISLLEEESVIKELSALELYNKECLELLKQHRSSPLLKELPEFPDNIDNSLYIEVSGNPDDTMLTLSTLLDIFEQVGGDETNSWAENGYSNIEKFISMRHAIPSLISEDNRILIDNTRFETDFSLPFNKCMCNEYLSYIDSLSNKYDLHPIVYGHVIDNEEHLAFLINNEEEKIKATEYINELSTYILDHQGLLVSSYGIGKTNENWLSSKVDLTPLDEIIKYFDSNNLFNKKGLD